MTASKIRIQCAMRLNNIGHIVFSAIIRSDYSVKQVERIDMHNVIGRNIPFERLAERIREFPEPWSGNLEINRTHSLIFDRGLKGNSEVVVTIKIRGIDVDRMTPMSQRTRQFRNCFIRAAVPGSQRSDHLKNLHTTR